MISEIEIRKFRGIRYARLRLGEALTVVMGGNGEGKSSFRHALKAAFQGGYDPADVNDPLSDGGSAIVMASDHSFSLLAVWCLNSVSQTWSGKLSPERKW